MTTLTANASITELRAAFRRMRDAGRWIFGRAWDAAVVETLARRGLDGSIASPSDWVEAAEAVEIECERCHGTGDYKWGGTINGKPVHQATCYHCGGRGRQDMDDMFRNKAYIRYSISRAV